MTKIVSPPTTASDSTLKVTVDRKPIILALATAAAISFALAPVTSAVAATNKVTCYGINSCKGQSECKTATTSCSGDNGCKGQGYLLMTPDECRNAGGRVQEPSS